MILLHSERFHVSEYHQHTAPHVAHLSGAQGLVTTLNIQFESWLEGRRLEAEAFIDPGADDTIISLRWIDKVAREAHRVAGSTPNLDRTMRIASERVIIQFMGVELELPVGLSSPRIGKQGIIPDGYRFSPAQKAYLYPMPGYEDILLGRDFLSRHGIMLLVDGSDRKFSMLYPVDEENRKRRKIIAKAFDPEEPLC